MPLADFLGGAVDPVLARQGFGQSSLILHWEEIVGERLAAASEPIKLQWPPRAPMRPPEMPPDPATLVLRVSGAMALEIQHSSPQLIERVNAHLGWRAVGRIALRQGPLQRAGQKHSITPPDPEALAQAREAAQGIEDEGLREALARLGARALRGKAGQE